MFGQSFIIFEKLRYMGQLLLKLRAVEVATKSWKLFGPSTTKWRPCKGFAKLNGNVLLMANIFKVHKYQTFGLMKMYNMCKI